MEHVKRWFQPSQFLTKEQAGQAYLLNIFLMAGGLAAVIYTLFVLLAAHERISRIPLLVPVIIIVLVCRHLSGRGYVRWASLIFVTVIWFVVTIAVFTGGGVKSLAFPSYLPIILFGGLILGARSGFVLVLLSALVGLAMVYLEQQALPPFVPSSTVMIWMVQVYIVW